MGREYARVATRFWSDQRVLNLSPTAKLVMLYLLTGPQTNCIGCFRLNRHHLAADGVVCQEEAEAALVELERVGLIRRDTDAGLVWLPRFFRYNTLANRNQALAALIELRALPNSKLDEEIAAAMQPIAERLPREFEQWARNRLPNGYPNGYPSGPATVTQTVTQCVSEQPSPSPSPSPSPKERIQVTSRAPKPDRISTDSTQNAVDKSAAWDTWTKATAAKLHESEGIPTALFTAYVAELERCLTMYYEGRGGRLTTTRRAYVASQLQKYDPAIQAFAIELFCDRTGTSKDERYLVGIARRLAKLSESEIHSDIARHRKSEQDRGLYHQATNTAKG